MVSEEQKNSTALGKPILSTSEGWKAELTWEPPSGFEHGTPGNSVPWAINVQYLEQRLPDCTG